MSFTDVICIWSIAQYKRPIQEMEGPFPRNNRFFLLPLLIERKHIARFQILVNAQNNTTETGIRYSSATRKATKMILSTSKHNRNWIDLAEGYWLRGKTGGEKREEGYWVG